MEDIIAFLKEYQTEGSKFGTFRTRALLDALNSPDKNLKIIHVAGTNGKGSVCEYITQILLSTGKRVGTFTSPEVYDYCEQFKINGTPVGTDILRNYLGRTYATSLQFDDKPSAFEIETAAALLMFASERCEYAVVECGLGGLNDATNAIFNKQLAVITSISLEHMSVLGDTVTEICAQKAGIIKGCPAVVSALQTEEGKSYFSSLGVKFAGEGLKVISANISGTAFTYNGENYKLKMHGVAQAYNAATAIEAAHVLGIEKEAISTGLARVQLGGRVEVIECGGTTYILDGSHNPASFSPLLDMVKGDKKSKRLIYGCLSDKDVESAAKLLSQVFERVIVLPPPSYRTMSLDGIYAAFSRYFKQIEICNTVSEALEKAQAQEIVVCGSFTLLKEARKWIGKRQ